MDTERSQDKSFKEKYLRFKRMYEDTQSDYAMLSEKNRIVKQKIRRVSEEREYLVDALCKCTASDFDSENDTESSACIDSDEMPELNYVKLSCLDGFMKNDRKRPLYPFELFLKDKHRIFQKSNPEVQRGELLRLVGETWKKLHPTEKELYVNQYKQQLGDFQQQRQFERLRKSVKLQK